MGEQNKEFQSIPINCFELVEDDSKKDKRTTPVKVWIAHTGKNLNKSNFSKTILENMIPSLANTPIVGFIEVDSKNKEDFKGHEERYIVTVDGVEVEYLGRIYGIIPESNNARFETKTVNGIEREYLVADGRIFNKFAKAKEIFDRDTAKHQSMELERDSFAGSYDKSNDEFVVTNAVFEALCILGDNRHPAMVGGLIEKVNFSTTKFELAELIAELKEELMEEVQALRTQFMKGGRVLDITKFEEILANYTYVSSEFAEDIKSKLESYESEESLVEVLKAENEVQYALTIEAQLEMLRKEVRDIESKEDYHGYTEHRYYMRDANFETMEVFCGDYEDWTDVGFSFMAEGDGFSIDKESKFSVVWQPMKLNEGQSSAFSVASEVKSAYELGAKVTEELKSAQEIISTFEAEKLAYEEKLAQYESQLEELDSLRKYKEADEERMKAEFVESVENLTVDEKAVFTENIANYTIESIKDEVVKFVGQKAIKFSVNEEKPIEDKVAPIRYEEEVNTKKPRAYETYDFSKKS